MSHTLDLPQCLDSKIFPVHQVLSRSWLLPLLGTAHSSFPRYWDNTELMSKISAKLRDMRISSADKATAAAGKSGKVSQQPHPAKNADREVS